MSYSKQQVMLTLSYLAYIGFALHEDDQKNETILLKAFNKALSSWQPVKDQWEVVWGPAVFSLPSTVFDDALMYVVRNINEPEKYVVAIRGTNPVSIPDWVVWDFQAKELKAWPYGQPQAGLEPKISESTNFGLIVLQNLRPSKGIPGEMQTIAEFLTAETKSLKGKKADICVTGHSLGGALSPTLALWLKDTQGEVLPATAIISTVAFAGPTAGNEDFAAHLDTQLQGQAERIANALDFIPHAWQTKTLKELYCLYLPLLPTPGMALFILKVIRDSQGNDYLHFEANTNKLKGKLEIFALTYFSQVLYQHVFAYPKLMGLSNSDIPTKDILKTPNLLSTLTKPFSWLRKVI